MERESDTAPHLFIVTITCSCYCSQVMAVWGLLPLLPCLTLPFFPFLTLLPSLPLTHPAYLSSLASPCFPPSLPSLATYSTIVLLSLLLPASPPPSPHLYCPIRFLSAPPLPPLIPHVTLQSLPSDSFLLLSHLHPRLHFQSPHPILTSTQTYLTTEHRISTFCANNIHSLAEKKYWCMETG